MKKSFLTAGDKEDEKDEAGMQIHNESSFE